MSTTRNLGDSFSIDSSENSYAPGIAVCRESASGGAINNQEIQDGTEVTISIAGSGAQPGDVLRVFIDDVLVAEHVLDASEISNSGGITTGTGIAKVTISADVLKALAQGGHIVTSQIAYSDNTLSNVSPAKGTLNIDTEGPDAPIAPTATDNVGQAVGVIPEAATTDDANPLFSGMIAAKYNTIEVFDNGVSLGRATVNSITGKWTLTPTTALTDGPHAITVVEYDRAGNPSPTSAAMNFTVDTGPANVAITKVTDNVGDIQTDVATGGVTDDTTPTLVGTAKANTVVTISEGTTVLGTTTADALGHWTFTPAVAQNQGAHTYTASITVAGNTTTSTNFVVTVDTTGPAVVVTPLGDILKTAAEATAATGVITVNSEVNSVSTVTFVGQNGQVVKVITNNGTAKPVVLTASDLTTLGDGAVEVTTVTKDKAGNVTTTTDGVDGDFTLDTVAAVAVADVVNTTEDVISTTGNVGTNDTSKDGSETYSLIGSATGVYGTLSLGSNGAYTYTRTANLDAIQITAIDTFTYQVRDAAGNTTLSTLKINMAPVNDAAVIGGVNTGSINESNLVQGVTGTLTIMDVDSSATFVVQTNVTGTNGYGKFSLNSAGVWTYTMNSAHDEFVAGVDYNDSFTASSADGTTKLVTVTMKGTNDQPTFTSTATIALSGTEDTAYNFVISNSLVGKVTDLDAGASVKGIAISWNQAPIDQGVWEWSTDGTTWAAVPADITGVATTFNNPANALYLNASDRLRFTPTANWNGNVNALVFRVADDTMPVTVSGTRLNVSSYNGSTGPMSLSPSSYTLNVSGVNDAPVIVTTANNITTLEDTATTFVIGTQLTGRVTDVDGTALKGIVIVQNTTTSGTWAYSTDGGATWVDFPTTYLGSVDWTKVMYLNATDSLRYTPAANTSGANLSDLNFRAVDASFPNTASGTQVSVISSIGGSGAVSGQAGHFTVSVTAVNDAPIGTNDTASATEASDVSNATAGANPSGNVLTNDTDADNATSTLVIKDILKGTTGTATAVAASTTSANGTSIVGTYGTLVIGADGSYTYSVNQSNATVQALNTTSAPLSDVFTYTVKDPSGLTGKATITVSVNGANDAAVIGGVSTATLTETNAAQTATGTLTITDVDSAATFVAQSNVVGSNGYGKFSVTAAGVWSYTMTTAHDEFAAGQTYTDSVTVAAADGTTKVMTVTITGTNDAAVIAGTNTATLTETNAAETATGTLTITDVDSAATFVAQTNVAKTYGSFSVTTAGVWTYTMNNAHNEFVAGTNYTDSLTVSAADGTTKVVTVTITGTNDAAVIAGTSTASLTETNVAQTATGTLTITDVDSAATFVAQSNVVGSNGYGKFSVTAAGVWTYAMTTAHDEFAAGQTYTDSITVAAADGTTKVVTVTITGANDAAVIAGTSAATLTETNVAQTATGTLTITDVDSAATFVAQSNVAGSSGYGKFSVTTAGVWSYVMNTAHDEFAAGTNYTDSLTVSSADGTTKVVTVTITGTNDAAVIAGTNTATLTETNAAQTATGTLTITDVDSAATFVAQTNVAKTYGKFSVTTAGVWTYTMTTAHDEFVAGQTYTDSVTVAAADGTTQVVSVTITGTNDAAVIAGTSTATLTETNVAQTATGTLTITDVDSATTFVAQSNVVGSNGYGKFSVTAAGVWSYTMNTAHDEFAAGQAYTDSLTVTSADGTTKLVTVTVNGSDDAAYISGTSTANLTETDIAQTATGTLSVTDVDSVANNTFVAQTNIAKTYGTFSVTTAGVWTYTMSTAHNEFVAGTTYTDSITVTSATGLSKVVTVTLLGTNDAAVIGGVSTASLTETNAAQTATGTLTITDPDNTAALVAQTNVAGNNGYGKFSVTAAGVWTYTMNTAHDEFLIGQVYTDSITVAAIDGTTKVVTVSITGTNDAPTLSYVDTGISNTDAITNNPAISVSSLEAAATWEYQVDNGAWTVGTGTVFTMSEGLHTYNVRQKDALNHVSAISSKTVTLDTVAPNAAGIALASDTGISNTDGVTNNGTLNIALSSDTNNWQYTTNGGTTWSNGTGATLGLAAGTYAANNVQVQALDKAGNATLSKYASAVTVDTTAPTVSVAIGNSALQFGQSTTVSFNFSEAVYGFTNGDVSVSGGSLSNITGSGKSYSATYTAGYSYNGGSYVSVNANTYTDQAGNNGGSSSTGSFRVGINVADVARGMSLYVTGYGHGWCDTQGWIGVGLWGNNDLQGATVTLYDGWGHSWSSNVAGSGGSTNFGTFSGGGNNLTKFHADISYGGQTASVGGGVAYEVTWRGLVGLGFFNCIKGDTAYTFCYSSPIVLDLNGDGVQTVDTAHGVQFDMSGDGHTQSVGWVDKHDALLVRDINHDGKINNGTELFGSDTVLKNGQKAGDGWAALADMDSNADGKVDAQDAAFADIQVWVDANSDGVTDAGELRGLIDAGIQSIDVTHANSNTTQNGNVLFGTGQFTKADGTTAALTDAWFEVGRTLALDFTQVKGQALDMSDGQAQTVTLDFKELMDYTQVNGALQLSGDAADVVKIVNGGAAVTANRQEINGQVFSAYDLNSDGMNDLLLAQAMNQAQLF